MEKFRTRTSIFHVSTQGIIHKTVIEGVNVNPTDIDEDQEMLLKLSGKKKALVLVNAKAFHTMTPEAIDRLKGYLGKSRIATAMVSASLGVRIFVNNLSLLVKNKSPFEMFPTEAQAVKWLLAQKRAQQKKSKRNKHNISVAPAIHQKPVTCKVQIDENGILVKTISEGAHVDLNSIKRAEKQAHTLAGNTKRLTIIDRRASYTITPGALKLIQKNVRAKYRIATALISPKQSGVEPKNKGNKQTPPVKVFKDKPSAVKWLLSLKRPQ